MRALFIFGCILPLLSNAQYDRDTLGARLVTWNAVRERSDTLTLSEVMDDDWHINAQLNQALAGVLAVPGLNDHAIDSLIPADQLHRVRSADGRLTLFSWDERTGGTFQAQVTLVFFRDARGIGHPVFDRSLNDEGGGTEWSRGGSYHAIHALGRTDSSTLYLCVGGVKGCSSCCSEMLTVIELTRDDIHFDYPAFEVGTDRNEEPLLGPTWELTARCGDVTRFDYDPKHKVARFTYTTDDLTPVPAGEGEARTITGSAHFDGKRFVVK
ncbi:MAG: hypothetical protein JNN32_03860 [Flavobacteriales bacterium]|nr:hypothetical protein [Flavobacteriales bacterium]